MRIGEAAEKAGLGATAIRFYEKEGVLPQPGRTASGYRDYTDADVSILEFVRRARSLEIPLDDIREIVGLRTRGKVPCGFVRNVIQREAVAIDTRIEELLALREELAHLSKIADRAADTLQDGDCVCHIIDVAATASQ